MTRKEWYHSRRRAGLIGSACANGAHDRCAGRCVDKKSRSMVRCQCRCHLGICRLCNQPNTAKARRAMLDAATRLELAAKDIRRRSGEIQAGA